MTPSRKRRATGASSSSQASSSRSRGAAPARSFDSSKFVSAKAQARFAEKARKTPILERGINVRQLQRHCPHMYEELVRRGLHTFINEPGEGNAMVVREFYANVAEHDNGVVTVRRRAVNASVDVIRTAYQLPPPPVSYDDFYEYGRNPTNEKWARFFETICAPGKEVVWMDYGEKFHSSALTFEGKCWLYLINNRLIPSHNTTEVNGPRAALIWCFVNGHDFDVAKVMHEEIFVRSQVKRYGFFFPSLVTQLCRDAQVPENLAVDGLVKKEGQFSADKVTTGKEPEVVEEEARGGRFASNSSDDSLDGEDVEENMGTAP